MLTATVTDSTPTEAPSPPAEDADRALARSAGAGDVAAFEALYRRHVGRVHGVIKRLVGSHSSRAEDLTQEAFVRAWQALPAYRFESAFGTWLHRLAVNTALMELRSRRSRPQADNDEDAFDTIGSIDSAGHVTALTHGPGARRGDLAAARPRSAGAARRGRLETRRDRRRTRHGGRQLEGTTASRARLVAHAPGGTRMNIKHDSTEHDFPDSLRWSLRGLRREAQPQHDLWPSIAQRIAATPQVAAAAPAPAWRRFAPLAMAASLALAVGLVWQLRPDSATSSAAPGAQLISAEADAMTREYQAALQEFERSAPATTDTPPCTSSIAAPHRSAPRWRAIRVRASCSTACRTPMPAAWR